MSETATHEVFVSYAHDDLDAVEHIVHDLEAAGLKVFWDQNLLPGQRWSEVIESALKSSKAVLVVWSQASVKSAWVRAEASAAMDRGTLVPVRIDEAAIPLPFGQVQSADLSTSAGSAYQGNFFALIEALRASGASREPVGTAAATPPSTQTWPRTKRVNFAYMFLALGGRLNRREYWLALLIFFAVTQLLPLLGPTRVRSWDAFESAQVVSFVTTILLLYPEFALTSKRLHDFDWSAWWALPVILIAVLDGLFQSAVLIPGGVSIPDARSGMDLAVMKPAGWAIGLTHFAILLVLGIPRGSRTNNRFGPAA